MENGIQTEVVIPKRTEMVTITETALYDACATEFSKDPSAFLAKVSAAVEFQKMQAPVEGSEGFREHA